MKKNKPSLCDALVIMREMMCKLPKKFFLMRNSCKRDTLVKTLCVWMQSKNQKWLIRFVLHTGLQLESLDLLSWWTRGLAGIVIDQD